MDVTANLCEYGSLSAKMDRKYSRPYGLRLAEKVQLNLDIKKLTIHAVYAVFNNLPRSRKDMESVVREDNEDDPERLFLNSIKSKATKDHYLVYLQKYLEFANCKTLNDLVFKFKDQKDIDRKVINFIIQLKEEGKNFRSIRNYLSPIISFYKINDIMLNSKKINKFLPTETRAKKNRGYSHEEVQKLLDIADERIRAVILLLVSSGCRIGAIPILHVRDIEKSGDVYKITIYENDAQEYFSFITSEAWNAVQSYLQMRERYGEKLTPDSILIREQFDIRDPFAIASPKTVGPRTISNKIAQLAERAGIREKIVYKGRTKTWFIQKVYSSGSRPEKSIQHIRT